MNLITLRDKFWEYPYFLFVGRRSLGGQIQEIYLESRPFSHVVLTLLVSMMIASLLLSQVERVLSFNQNTFVEGVVVGATPAGDPRGPSKLNPLQLVSPQLDKDIVELVYEPLIRVDQTGKIIPILAQNYTEESTKSGVSYRFSLRKDAYWHDGRKLTTKDVKATFDLIKDLGGSGVPNVYSGKAMSNINLEVLDDYICRFSIENGILPNFFEIITFKILPSHEINQYRDAFIRLTDAEKLTTIGTGPYILNKIGTNEVKLTANKKYYLGQPKIDTFKFRLLRDENEAVNAVKSGQIHALVNLNSEVISALTDNANYSLHFSTPIYTQYWAIYFNLSDEGPSILKNAAVRRAFSYAINRDLAVRSALGNAEPAYGPIPKISKYYGSDAQQPGYNRDLALNVLRKDGWKLEETVDKSTGKRFKVQTKKGKQLIVELAYADNPDRTKLVNSVKADLAAVGIILNVKSLEPQQLANVRLNQDFNTLLFGVSTFVDPDRYEFFNSTQTIANDGLNLSSYKSTKTTTVIDPDKHRAVRIPLVDRLLDEGRKISDFKDRRSKYVQFQSLIAEDNPAIFLYHPTVRYLVSDRVRNVDLSDVRSTEERFYSVYNWTINFD